MHALGFISNNSAPVLFEQDTPNAHGKDLLVEIEAVAVNPVDTKVKAGIQNTLAIPKILGWDAVGTVIAIGDDVELFTVGDRVYYAGDVSRDGCYASHQLVDERIAAHAPTTLSPEQIAAMPLTSLTAWEALFSRLKIQREQDAGKNILIIGGAGGVGSIAIQLAKQIAGLNVITTASKSDSEQWCYDRGADYVINHHGDLILQYRSLGITDPDYILCLNNTDLHFASMAELIAPQGMICSIVGTSEKHDLDCLKSKSAGFVWEFMFTRPMFNTKDMINQHHILTQIQERLDDGTLTSTLTKVIGDITPDNLTAAHEALLSGSTIGKIALSKINV